MINQDNLARMFRQVIEKFMIMIQYSSLLGVIKIFIIINPILIQNYHFFSSEDKERLITYYLP